MLLSSRTVRSQRNRINPFGYRASVVGMVMMMVAALNSGTFANGGATPYVAGLTALTTGNFEAAANSFDQAIKAWDEEPDYHIGSAIANIMTGNRAAVKQHLDRATRLSNRRNAAVPVWHFAYVVMYEPMNLNRQHPYNSKEPYASCINRSDMPTVWR